MSLSGLEGDQEKKSLVNETSADLKSSWSTVTGYVWSTINNLSFCIKFNFARSTSPPHAHPFLPPPKQPWTQDSLLGDRDAST